jgi:hypothetical protein
VFAVVRHPDVADPGICPQASLEYQRGLGWYRVSPWFDEPSAIHLPAYAESDVDLDAPEPEPEPVKPTKAAKPAADPDDEKEE